MLFTPKFIYITLMYRDGCNNKTSETFSFLNDEALTNQAIKDWFAEHLIQDEVQAIKYGLPNLAACTFVTDECSSDDHCFMEVTDFCFGNSIMGVKADELFSPIYHAMIDDKGIKGWRDIERKEQVKLIKSSFDRVAGLVRDLKLSKEAEEDFIEQVQTLSGRFESLCV